MLPDDMTQGELIDALRCAAAGDYGHEAAIGMLIEQQNWLLREEFRQYIEFPRSHGGPILATIRWSQVVTAIVGKQFPASSGELSFLKAAAMVSGHGDWRLADLMTGLDVLNIRTVLQAIAHIAGWHERGVEATITGNLHAGPATAPSFEESRVRALRLVHDAADELRAGDWPAGPNTQQRRYLRDFFQHSTACGRALDGVARHATPRQT